MSHGYINPKKIAELGQTLLEEAILTVLSEVHFENKRYLTNKEISERAGIHCYSRGYGIVRVLARKLEENGMIANERRWNYSPQQDRWARIE